MVLQYEAEEISMKKIYSKMMIRLLAAVLLTAAISFQSLAATARIAFSDPSTQVGQEVSVTMKFTSTSGDMLGDTDVMLSYDATMLEFLSGTGNVSGGTGAIRVKSAPAGATEAVTELKFKALKAGTASITVASWEGYDNNGQSLNVEREGSSKITISPLETSSNDATLQSLQVSPGTLSPAFTPMQENYTVEVGLDTERITIDAPANNAHAVVTIEGGDNLQEGANTVVCKVTAEDGTTVKKYTLTVNKTAGGGAEDPAGGTEPTQAPEAEVLAELDVTAKKIRITALPDGVEVPAGFKSSSIAIGDTKVPGWTWEADETPRYCVFYGLNEDGEADFYRYDLKEKTVQRYFADQGASQFTDEQFTSLAEDYNSLLEDYRKVKLLMFGGFGLALILLIALIVVSRASSKRPSGRDDEDRYDSAGRGYREGTDKAVRTAGGRRMTREERYMRGVEDEYEEEDDDEIGDDYDLDEVPDEVSEGVEAALAEDLAREAAAAAEPAGDPGEDEDDFEFFDLDDEN